MDKINEYLKKTRKTVTLKNGYAFNHIRPRIECADGFSISVQASVHHYCTPRINGADNYEAVELGFPSMEDSLIMDYAEEPVEPTETVYGYVPVELVNELIDKHGGIVNLEEP